MIKFLKLIAALALFATPALAQGPLVDPVTGSMTVPITSGTLAAETSIDNIKTYVQGSFGNTVITGTLDVTGQTDLGGAVGAASVTVPVVSSSVNEVSLSGGATTAAPVITVGGSGADSNIGIVLSGKGTGAAHLGGTTAVNASLRVPTVTSAVNQIEIDGAIATTGIPFITVGGSSSDTNASLAVYGKGTGSVLIGDSTTTLAGLQVAKTTSAVNGLTVTPGATGTAVAIGASTAGADTNTGITLTGKGTGAILIGGATTTLAGLQVAQTASRVNDFVLTPNATGTAPVFEAGGAGADATVGATFGTAGTGNIAIDTGATVQQFGVTHTASAVDYLACTGAATADPALVTCTATGSDTNVNIVLATKAAGNVKLGTSTASTCSGTTTATCQGQRFVVSITGLSTAASTLSAAMTVTDANVVSSSSNVLCQTQGYAGTGVPVVVNIVPGTGNVAMKIQNVSTGAALNATVAVACLVLGT